METGKTRRTKEEPAVVETPQSNLPRLVVVQLNDDGKFTVQQQGIELISIPTLLRLAAKQVETQLGM